MEEQQSQNVSPKPKFNLKKALPIILIIILLPFEIALWYLAIPLLLIWFLWKRAKLEKNKRIIFTAITILIFLVIIIIKISYQTTAPQIIISEPQDNAIIQAEMTMIKGVVKPSKSKLLIDGQRVKIEADGEFNYEVALLEEKKILKIEATEIGTDKTTNILLTINHPLTEKQKEELAAKQKAEEEARKKAKEQEAAREKAEQAAWDNSKAGKICKSHPEWTREECTDLANNKIWIGMSLDMLKARRGLPNSANPSNYGSGTQWQWCWHDYTPSCFYDHDDDGIIDSYN